MAAKKNMNNPLPYLKPRVLFQVVFAGYFLLGMHYYSPNMGGHALYMPYNIIGWMFVSVLIGLGLWQISRTGYIELTRFYNISWLGIIFMVLPMIYPNNEFASWASLRIQGLLCGIMFYLSLLQFKFSKQERYWILYIILCGVFIESILGVLQYYFFQPGNSMNYDVEENFPYGIFQQRNNMGIFMVTGCAISLYLFHKDSEYNNSKLKLFVLLAVPLFSSIILVGVKSKAVFIAYGLFLAGMSFSIDWRMKWTKIWIAISVTGFLFGVFSPALFQRKFSEKTIEHQIGTVFTRKNRFETTYQLWMRNPLLGGGYGSFRKKYREQHAYRRANEPGFKSREGFMDHPHNEILFWAAEGGIAPLIGLIIIAGAYLIMVFRVHWKEALAYLAIILPITITTQTEFPFYISLSHWIVFLTLVYVPDAESESMIRVNFRLHRLIIIPAVLIPILMINYMGKALQTAKVITQFELTGYNNYSLLRTAKNPYAWRLKYENYTLKMLLDTGLETNNHEILQLFLNRSEEFVRFVPLLHVYEGMEMALKALGREQEAIAVVKKAHYLYPDLENDSKWIYFALKNIGQAEEANMMLENARDTHPDIYEELYEYQQSPSNKSDRSQYLDN